MSCHYNDIGFTNDQLSNFSKTESASDTIYDVARQEKLGFGMPTAPVAFVRAADDDKMQRATTTNWEDIKATALPLHSS